MTEALKNLRLYQLELVALAFETRSSRLANIAGAIGLVLFALQTAATPTNADTSGKNDQPRDEPKSVLSSITEGEHDSSQGDGEAHVAQAATATETQCEQEEDPALSEAMNAVDRWLDREHHRFPSAPISSSVATIYYALEARLKAKP